MRSGKRIISVLAAVVLMMLPTGCDFMRITEEEWMKNQNIFTTLKLRLGYGITGQQELNNGDYPYLATYTKSSEHQVFYPVGYDNYAEENRNAEQVFPDQGQYVVDNNGNILYYSYRPNAYNYDLTWEKTTTYNAGIDFSFLNNRISGSVDYYYRKTDDLLNTVTVAAGTNFRNRVISNVGSLSNQGIEFAINAVAIDMGRKFKWDLGYNLTWNQNKILRLNTGESQTALLVGGISSGTGNTIQQHAVGQAAYSFYVYEAKSNVAEDGTKYWYVVDRDNNGSIDENDKYFFHSAAAPISMGFQMKFQFYDFDLGMSFRSNIGNYVYNDVKASNLQMVTRENFNRNNFVEGILTQCFDTYYNDNMRSDVLYANPERTAKFDKWYATDYFVENASFLRCDNITLGWSFKRPKINGRVYATVSNPFVITGYSGLDPEHAFGIDNNIYPRSMTTVLGINLQF